MEKALQQCGVDVHIATTDDDGPGRRCKPRPPQPGLARHWFAKRTELYKVAPSMGTWLAQHVASYDMVHIHALFSYSSLAAARAAHRAGVPYVVRPLGTLTKYGVQQRRPWLKQASLKLLEGPMLRRAAAVHFTAQAEQDEAMELGIPMRACVIPLAVEPEAAADVAGLVARFPALQGGGHVLFLSRVDPKKNIEALLDAMAMLVPAHPGITLAVVGDGKPEYVASLQARAQALGIANRVVWTGFLAGGLKAAALKTASVFVLPSFSENFGIAAAEAMLAGLPCVLGQGVAIAADCERFGAGLAVAPTAEATARGVQAYLSSVEARQAAGEAARRFAEQHYSTAAMGQALLALYQRLLAAGTPATALTGAV